MWLSRNGRGMRTPCTPGATSRVVPPAGGSAQGKVSVGAEAWSRAGMNGPLRGGGGFEGAPADVTAAEALGPVDPVDRLVGAVARLLQIAANRGDVQDP